MPALLVAHKLIRAQQLVQQERGLQHHAGSVGRGGAGDVTVVAMKVSRHRDFSIAPTGKSLPGGAPGPAGA
jgi:hypothetical protein